jgi:hypothetical protein
MASRTQLAANAGSVAANALDAVEAGAMGQLLECLKDGTLEAKQYAVRAISRLNTALAAGGISGMESRLEPASSSQPGGPAVGGGYESGSDDAYSSTWCSSPEQQRHWHRSLASLH